MRHDPESDSGDYLSGAISHDRHTAFSEHLLSCQPCWWEVSRARAGRAALETAREVAPAELRDRVRALVEAEGTTVTSGTPRSVRRRAHQVMFSLAITAAVVAALTLGGSDTATGDMAPSLRQAVADYTAGVLPGTHMAASSAPDLTGLGLQPVGAGAGSYGALAVDGYSYTGPRGGRVMLYLSARPFPEPEGAAPLDAVDGPWMAHRGDVVVLCGVLRSSRAVLVVGEDDQLVTAAARTLGAL